MHPQLQSVVVKFLEVFMPGAASALKTEGQFSLADHSRSGTLEPSAYIDVEDNGADVTLVSFAGMAVLYAAMPKFEFKSMLQEGGGKFNFVFVRDIFRSSYRLAPDGSNEGIAFYERVVREALEQLGAKCTIAIGMSGGAEAVALQDKIAYSEPPYWYYPVRQSLGAVLLAAGRLDEAEAAFRISGATPIDRIIAFNPAFPMEHHGSWSNICLILLDLKKLVTTPGAYFETLLVTLGTCYLWRRNRRLIGYEDPELPLRDYLRRSAPAVLFYSQRCIPDVRQALALKDVPSITLTVMESSRHNCLVEMKKKGIAGKFIGDEIRKQVASCLK